MHIPPSEYESEVEGQIEGLHEHLLVLRSSQIVEYIKFTVSSSNLAKKHRETLVRTIFEHTMNELREHEIQIRGVQLYNAEEVISTVKKLRGCELHG
mgnify:CR=1 FL=1